MSNSILKVCLIASCLTLANSSPAQLSILSSSLDDSAVQGDAVLPADGGLGSTLTLRQIQDKPQRTERLAENESMSVRPAAEPRPPLKHRFWLPDHRLKPGSAQLHFMRALVLWHQLPNEFRGKVESWAGAESAPNLPEVKQALASLTNVFEELHQLAQSEDMRWDHRLRELKGPAIYSYLLPEFQEARSLGRLLELKISQDIRDEDMEAAIVSIQDGFRLSAFVGQGETLIQQLVGIAIGRMMIDKVAQLMQAENAPSFYWALATLPRPFIDVRHSIMLELEWLPRVLPLLKEAESDDHRDDYWDEAWSQMILQLQALGLEDKRELVALAFLARTAGAQAKQRLIESGMNADKVNGMPQIRAVLLDASREIERLSHEILKGTLLPQYLGHDIIRREHERFEEYIKGNRLTSAASSIAGLLLPAVQAANSAGIRQEYFINRLMTIEALRLHAGAHGGELPRSLEQLSPVPALSNPFNAKPFDYELRIEGENQIVTLDSDVPPNLAHFRSLRVKFPKP